MASPGRILRAPALIAAGSLAVHEGRYLAGYGGGAHAAEAEQGHGYLAEAVIPAVQVLVALSVGALVLAFVRAMRGLTLGVGGRWRIRVQARVSEFDQYTGETTVTVGG